MDEDLFLENRLFPWLDDGSMECSEDFYPDAPYAGNDDWNEAQEDTWCFECDMPIEECCCDEWGQP